MAKIYRNMTTKQKFHAVGACVADRLDLCVDNSPDARPIDALRRRIHNLTMVVQTLIGHMPADKQREVLYALGYEEVDDGK